MGIKFVRHVLIAINFIFVLCGIALIVVGALGTKQDMTHFMDSKYLTAPILLCAIGGVMFVVAFLGCCGALRYNHFMVMAFAVLVFIIMIIEVGGAAAAYYYKGQVEDFLRKNMNTSLAQQRSQSVKIWDMVQYRFKCCGIDGPEDYVKLNLKIPDSCCKSNKDCSEAESWKGCFSQMLELTKGNITIIGGVAIGIAAIELIGCLFALCLARSIKKYNEDR
ncbi:CD63 antigen [Parasteatoda tepidariorum]|uniref:CD63 antigen n=1 Tax=Parasteatoda tepidariorum TaxID=114398 RepID=UPI00077F86B7|nr:CD63 antigen [Parasteatoda tepidariorum]